MSRPAWIFFGAGRAWIAAQQQLELSLLTFWGIGFLEGQKGQLEKWGRRGQWTPDSGQRPPADETVEGRQGRPGMEGMEVEVEAQGGRLPNHHLFWSPPVVLRLPFSTATFQVTWRYDG